MHERRGFPRRELHYEEVVEDEVEDPSRHMLNLINDLLLALRREKVEVLDWELLCLHQERLTFELFFVIDNISVDDALLMLRNLVEEALNKDHC